LPRLASHYPSTTLFRSRQLTVPGEIGKRSTLPGGVVAIDIRDDSGLQHKETPIDPANFIAGFFFEARHLILRIDIEHAKTPRRLDRKSTRLNSSHVKNS